MLPVWLANLLPTIASALISPAAGLAVPVISKALGLSSSTQESLQEILSSSSLSPEQLSSLKQAELDLQAQEKELGFKYAELEIRDRESARARESTVKDNVNRNLAYCIVLGFLSTVGFTLAGLSKVDTVTAGMLIGYLSAKAEQVLAYYFGTTRSSQIKDNTIGELSKK